MIRDRLASGEDKGDLLSMLLKAVDEEGDGTGMTDEQASDEAITLFNAGQERRPPGSPGCGFSSPRIPRWKAMTQGGPSRFARPLGHVADLPSLPTRRWS